MNTVDLQQVLDKVVDGFTIASSAKHAGGEVAEAISYSSAQSHRIFIKRFGEAPAHFKRRLILERSAEQLQQTDEPVWKIALESGFKSSEPFLRAFRRSFNVTPTAYRRVGGADTWLPTKSNLHYWRGTIVSSVSKGETKMNLTDRMIEHNIYLTGAVLDRAKSLSDKQLDAKLDNPLSYTFFESPDKTLRELLDGLIMTKEAWMAAMYNRSWQPAKDKSMATLIERWKSVEPDFRKMASDVAKENRWDDLFVDALCCPPATFSFGGVFAHILTVDAVRRAFALNELRKHGIEDLRWGCPIEWERDTGALSVKR
jgi:AraC family transcriptional regulator